MQYINTNYHMFSEQITLPLQLATAGSLDLWPTKGYIQPL